MFAYMKTIASNDTQNTLILWQHILHRQEQEHMSSENVNGHRM